MKVDWTELDARVAQAQAHEQQANPAREELFRCLREDTQLQPDTDIAPTLKMVTLVAPDGNRAALQIDQPSSHLIWFDESLGNSSWLLKYCPDGPKPFGTRKQPGRHSGLDTGDKFNGRPLWAIDVNDPNQAKALFDHLGWSNEDAEVDGFWPAFAATLGASDAGWTASQKNWVRLRSAGASYVACVYNGREGWVRVGIGLGGDHAQRNYEDLLVRRAALESEFGEPLSWDSKEGRTKRQIFVKLPCAPDDHVDWPRQHRWMADRVPFFDNLLGRIQ